MIDTESHNVTAAELRSFIDRIEAEEQAISERTDDRKEIYAEAKSRGYDTKVVRKIIAMRKRKPDEIAEEEAVLETYLAALEMA